MTESFLNKLMNQLEEIVIEFITLDKEKVSRFIKQPLLINYDAKNDKLFYENEDKEIDDYFLDIEELGTETTGEWLSNRLIDPPFSTTFPNNRKMEKEARAIYKITTLVKLLKPTYASDYAALLKNYDFSKLEAMPDADVNYKNFESLLAHPSSNARLLGKCILSACNYVFKRQKKQIDPILDTAEESVLENLGILRKNLLKSMKEEINSEKLSWRKGGRSGTKLNKKLRHYLMGRLICISQIKKQKM